MIYTIGHELIHFQQINSAMGMEKTALKNGELELTNFLNYYGNYLGLSTRVLEKINYQIKSQRRTFYGHETLMNKYANCTVLNNLKKAVNISDRNYNNQLQDYGSLLGLITNTGNQVKTKALQEIIPALENAKNILFAKELGLVVNFDEVSSALPTASEEQKNELRPLVMKLARSCERSFEDLLQIANHQLFGVGFSHSPKEADSDALTLYTQLPAIFLGPSYNQTQQ